MFNLLPRLKSISNRFGLTAGKFESFLSKYSAIARETGCTATLPITTMALRRHPDLVRRYCDQGIQYDIHGYRHIDYQPFSGKVQIEDFYKAITVFNEYHVPYSGFRAPFLRCNSDTPYVLGSLNFLYDSSHSIYWEVLDETSFPEAIWKVFRRTLDYYEARSSSRYMSLPRFSSQEQLIEIPVCLPDDESMIEKLKIKDSNVIAGIWNAVLHETHRRGELFTISLHPERVESCGKALKDVINNARKMQPGVWCTTLREIAAWWKEKQKYRLFIYNDGKGRYNIQATCPEKATILVKNCRVSGESFEFHNGYYCMKARNFLLESPRKPVIGLGLNSSPRAARFLQSEGYIIEVTDKAEECAIHFNNLRHFQQEDEKRLVDKIEKAEAPLVRFGRWPYQTASALAVTGEIDSITLFDFILTLIEARQLAGKQRNEALSTGARVAI